MRVFSVCKYITILLAILLTVSEIIDSRVYKSRPRADPELRSLLDEHREYVPWVGNFTLFKIACYSWLDYFERYSCFMSISKTRDFYLVPMVGYRLELELHIIGHEFVVRCKRFPKHRYYHRCGLPRGRVPVLIAKRPVTFREKKKENGSKPARRGHSHARHH